MHGCLENPDDENRQKVVRITLTMHKKIALKIVLVEGSTHFLSISSCNYREIVRIRKPGPSEDFPKKSPE